MAAVVGSSCTATPEEQNGSGQFIHFGVHPPLTVRVRTGSRPARRGSAGRRWWCAPRPRRLLAEHGAGAADDTAVGCSPPTHRQARAAGAESLDRFRVTVRPLRARAVAQGATSDADVVPRHPEAPMGTIASPPPPPPSTPPTVAAEAGSPTPGARPLQYRRW